MRLTADDFEGTRKAAMGAVRVPQHVIQLLADLRTYLQVGRGLCGWGFEGWGVVIPRAVCAVNTVWQGIPLCDITLCQQ